ncbi:uncharacterized protein [Nicotiana tomentosiformis]|uniref:uncharacterized protein n=1 Tax=Nicotiana tomentosiformis TaxID=4098 RepID=UPI00388CC86F
MEVANFLKTLASEKYWKKMHPIFEECLMNNAMHRAVQANYLASESLQRLILDKQGLAFDRDQLLAERNQLDVCLPVLEAKATEMGKLETRLQQSEQDKMAHNQEVSQLHEQFQEAQAKWAEPHDVVLATVERESAFKEQINNLKADLSSKTEEANVAEEKRAKMEERLKKAMDQNRIHSTTNVELDSRLSALRSERDGLQAEINKLQAKFQDQEDSLVFEKTYVVYHMRRKTLEEAKMRIVDIDDCIVKARELKLTARENIPARPAATNSSSTGFEYSRTKEEIEEDEDEGPEGGSAFLYRGKRRSLSPFGLRR